MHFAAKVTAIKCPIGYRFSQVEHAQTPAVGPGVNKISQSLQAICEEELSLKKRPQIVKRLLATSTHQDLLSYWRALSFDWVSKNKTSGHSTIQAEVELATVFFLLSRVK